MRTVSDEQTAEILNRLIRANKDSANGLQRAAAELRDIELPEQAETLEVMAQERAQMVDGLQRAVSGLGEEPETTGTGSDALQRGWFNIKAAMTIEHDKTREVIFEDVTSEEEDVLEAYGSALEKQLPDPIRALLQEQQQAIREDREQLESIETEGSA